MSTTKKYWLKLNKDFLKSPQIKVIKDMPNGKDYVIFYLSLMLESIETVGHLRFTSFIPYNAEMLATITETNVDIVRSAIKLFCEIGLMQIFDDGTIFMTQVPEMTGKECDSAERVRQFRARKEIEKNEENNKMLQCNSEVTKCNSNIYIDKDINKNKKIDKYINPYKNHFELNYKNILKSKPFLSSKDQDKIIELYSIYDEEIIIQALQKLKNIAFEGIDFKPSASWLLKDNNFERVMNGEFDKQKEEHKFEY